MFRRSSLLPVSLLAVVSVLCVAARASAAGKAIKPGDKVKVTIGPAPVKIGKQTLTTVEAGAELTALKVSGKWVRVNVETDGKKYAGWIHIRQSYCQHNVCNNQRRS